MGTAARASCPVVDAMRTRVVEETLVEASRQPSRQLDQLGCTCRSLALVFKAREGSLLLQAAAACY